MLMVWYRVRKSQVLLSGINGSKKSQIKTMLITFFDIKSIAHFEFTTHGQIVNQPYYVEILKRLREAVCKRSPKLNPAIGFSTMTKLQLTRHSPSSSFWHKNRLMKWKTNPIPLIWLRMTSACFQK
jgi:hypothetical protein